MVKRAHYPLRVIGWWAIALLATLIVWDPAGTQTFAQEQAGARVIKTSKPAPKSAKVSATKKAGKAGNPKVPELPAREKVVPATAGLRDPFKKPEPPRVGPEGRIDEPRPPGQRGLAVGEMVLEGIVREEVSKTMIAVVAGPERRAYFLRVDDPVYHAKVSRITTDAVYFTETYRDPAGHEGTREVAKKMPATGGKP